MWKCNLECNTEDELSLLPLVGDLLWMRPSRSERPSHRLYIHGKDSHHLSINSSGAFFGNSPQYFVSKKS